MGRSNLQILVWLGQVAVDIFSLYFRPHDLTMSYCCWAIVGKIWLSALLLMSGSMEDPVVLSGQKSSTFQLYRWRSVREQTVVIWIRTMLLIYWSRLILSPCCRWGGAWGWWGEPWTQSCYLPLSRYWQERSYTRKNCSENECCVECRVMWRLLPRNVDYNCEQNHSNH